MEIKRMVVSLCARNEIKEFIECNHYSGSINGCITDYCFKLEYDGRLIGACFYGRMAMANQWKRFSDSPDSVIELRRLCCIDDTPRNTESFFIGATLRWLRKNTPLSIVVSYADQEYGHAGTIYKASNFSYIGFSPGAKVIHFNGRRYHDKSIRTKYNGTLKPFAQRLVAALKDGTAYFSTTAGKHCYTYSLR